MSSDLALRVVNLGKRYRIRHEERHVTATEHALDRLRHPFRRPAVEVFDALSGVDLDVHRGEVLGLIGRNGAGKSTLLKVLSRITPPTKGRIELFGRVGSLLEVGTGFHPELTGRENVYLNGSILGMSRGEIDAAFDAIVAFAEVERFLDTPVKRYSSGMYVRLAFAVAAHLRSEILLVDEVLAVGDAEFQARCLGKMHDVASDGRTVILVSHNLDSIARLCDRVALLQGGRVSHVGEPQVVIGKYRSMGRGSLDLAPESSRLGSGEWRIAAASTDQVSYRTDVPKRLSIRVEPRTDAVPRFFVSAHIVDEQGRVVAQCDSRMTGAWFGADGQAVDCELVLRSPWLLPGQYEIELYVCNAGILDACQPACTMHVDAEHPYAAPLEGDTCRHNLVLPDFTVAAVRNTERSDRGPSALDLPRGRVA